MWCCGSFPPRINAAADECHRESILYMMASSDANWRPDRAFRSTRRWLRRPRAGSQTNVDARARGRDPLHSALGSGPRGGGQRAGISDSRTGLGGNNGFDGSIAAGTLDNPNEPIKMGTTSATQCLPSVVPKKFSWLVARRTRSLFSCGSRSVASPLPERPDVQAGRASAPPRRSAAERRIPWDR